MSEAFERITTDECEYCLNPTVEKCRGCYTRALELVSGKKRLIASQAEMLREELIRIHKLKAALQLVLLFHQGVWDDKNKKMWSKITGGKEATTRVMCDFVREALE